MSRVRTLDTADGAQSDTPTDVQSPHRLSRTALTSQLAQIIHLSSLQMLFIRDGDVSDDK